MKCGPRPREYTCSSCSFGARDRRAARAGPGVVHRLAIGARGQRDVIGILVAAFDFERRDADLDDLGNLPQRVEIARRKQIARVGQRLRLRHPPSVRRAGGRLARTGRDWRCGRPRLPTKSTGRNRTRRARRGRTFRARNRSAARMARISSSDSSRAITTRLTPRLCAKRTPSALVMLICVLPWMFEIGRDLRAPVSRRPDPAR